MNLKQLKLIFLSVITFSCENDNTNIESHVEQQKFGEITLTKSIDSKLINQVLNYNINTLNTKQTYDYDFDNSSQITIDNSTIKAISVPQNISGNYPIQRRKSYVLDEHNDIVRYFTSETKYLSNNKVEVKYFDINGLILSHFIIDKNSKEVDFLSSNNFGKNKEKSCGQAIIDCMGDKYTNNGWDSVFLTIGTAFLPEIAVGVAVVCVYESDECKYTQQKYKNTLK